MDYALLKLVHQSMVALTIVGFVARGGAALAGADWVRGRAARTLPHVVDTLLLASALAMLWVGGLSPLSSWLLAKIVALVVYVVLGAVALRPGRARSTRCAALVGAIGAFGYIVSVALTKDPLGPFAWR